MNVTDTIAFKETSQWDNLKAYILLKAEQEKLTVDELYMVFNQGLVQFLKNRTSVTMIPVHSSNIGSVGYDNATKDVHVAFLNSPFIYIYENVPETIFEELKTAESVGSFLNKKIKGAYPFHKITLNP